MADQVQITGPIELKDNSKASVALRLMERISQYEEAKDEKKSRDYWLKLYIQCYAAVADHPPADVLKRL